MSFVILRSAGFTCIVSLAQLAWCVQISFIGGAVAGNALNVWIQFAFRGISSVAGTAHIQETTDLLKLARAGWMGL